MMKSILITGCNRGLGLGLVKELVKDKNAPEHIITTCRDIGKAEELRNIANQNKNVHILELDVTDFNSYPSFSEKVSQIVQSNGLNVLFNNAGYAPKSTRLNFVKVEQLKDTLTINTIAPIMLTKALLPLLKHASKKYSGKPKGISKAAVINMTSYLGSIELTDGGLYPYRCSKAALNMATKTLSIDLRDDDILVTCIHPGWVKTDMGGTGAPMDIQTSTSSIWRLMQTLGEQHNGQFCQWDGKTLPW